MCFLNIVVDANYLKQLFFIEKILTFFKFVCLLEIYSNTFNFRSLRFRRQNSTKVTEHWLLYTHDTRLYMCTCTKRTFLLMVYFIFLNENV